MSLINEALKRARQDAARQDAARKGEIYPWVDPQVPARRESRVLRLGLVAAAGVVALAVAAVLLVLLMRRPGEVAAAGVGVAAEAELVAVEAPGPDGVDGTATGPAGIGLEGAKSERQRASAVTQGGDPAGSTAGGQQSPGPASRSRPEGIRQGQGTREPRAGEAGVRSGGSAGVSPAGGENGGAVATPAGGSQAAGAPAAPPSAGAGGRGPAPGEAASSPSGDGAAARPSPGRPAASDPSVAGTDEAASGASPGNPAAVFVREAALPGGVTLSLGGIAWSQDQPYALLNGRVMGPGELIEGYTVERVHPDRVELRGEAGLVVLRLR